MPVQAIMTAKKCDRCGGYWETEWECSVCGETEWRTSCSRMKFCMFCGAQMDDKREGETHEPGDGREEMAGE